ncbi:hypothetical protein M3Y98_00736200 [Aphelenchoides besseyi]|nr:hypothetical protein M3Y98_00736200 [Aphelenchoides besseyi]
MFDPIPITWFRAHDTIASSLGLFLNLLLISAAWKRTNPAFRSYGHMVLVYAINDTIYALVSLACQRVIELKNGTLFHMGFGLEVGAPMWLSQTVEFSNEVVCMQATAIIPTIYYFRYVLISKTRQATIRLLILLTFFSTVLSVTFGISDLLSRSAASKRGTRYYVKQLDAYWNAVNSTAAFTSANDMDDISTITHFFYWSHKCDRLLRNCTVLRLQDA